MAKPFVQVKIEGGEQLLRDLRKAGGNAKKANRGATKGGSEVIREDAERRAPQTRSKRKVISKVSNPRPEVAEAKIQVAKKAWFLKFFETGATAHEIRGEGKRLAFEGDAGLIIIGGVRHPGMIAKPFLRPAFDAKMGEAERRYGELMRQAVEEARIAQAARDEEE